MISKALFPVLLICLFVCVSNGFAESPSSSADVSPGEEVTREMNEVDVPMGEAEAEVMREEMEERVGAFDVHFSAVGYYQGMNNALITGNGYTYEYKNPNGVGFAADLEVSFVPVKGGVIYGRVHAGEGYGADASLMEDPAAPGPGVYANLNTISDDNPGDDVFGLLELYYWQSFFNERLSFLLGKTEPFLFIDDNAYANDEYSQFVGKPFVNDPVLDTEDEYAPILAIQGQPIEQLTLTFVAQSSTWPRLDPIDQKGSFERIFDNPFLAGQIAYSPEISGLAGNYRVYGWAQTYPHPEISGTGTQEGWGVGVSLDQEVHERVGLFARAGYHNEKVYEVSWFWSVGTALTGLIPGRRQDTLGVGVAGLLTSEGVTPSGMEGHLEAYYRLDLGAHFSVTPDIQYVWSPLGGSGNNGIVAGMLRISAAI